MYLLTEVAFAPFERMVGDPECAGMNQEPIGLMFRRASFSVASKKFRGCLTLDCAPDRKILV